MLIINTNRIFGESPAYAQAYGDLGTVCHDITNLIANLNGPNRAYYEGILENDLKTLMNPSVLSVFDGTDVESYITEAAYNLNNFINCGGNAADLVKAAAGFSTPAYGRENYCYQSPDKLAAIYTASMINEATWLLTNTGGNYNLSAQDQQALLAQMIAVDAEFSHLTLPSEAQPYIDDLSYEISQLKVALTNNQPINSILIAISNDAMGILSWANSP